MRVTGMRRAGRTALAAALLVAAPAAVAGAQATSSRARVQCGDCTGAERAAIADRARAVQRAARSLQREVVRLERAERDDTRKRALRDAAAALSRLDAADARGQGELARALSRLTVAQAHAGVDTEQHAKLMELVDRVAALQGAVASASAHAVAARALADAERAGAGTGWLGIAYSGDPARRDAVRGPYFYFRAYPVIASVDPGSPAEAAGLEAGDTIVAFGGRDVRARRIYHRDVLKPGEKLWVRVRRRGDVRETKVAVKGRPFGDHFVQRFEQRVESGRPPTRVRYGVRVGDAARAPRAPRAALAPAAPLPPAAALAPAAPAPPGLFIWSGPSVVAGAELARMNDDLRDALGVEGGVLVLDVGRGTPAAEAGLRAGDVILRAAGRSVASPARVQRAVEGGADGRRVELDVVRKGTARTVVIKW